MATQAGGLGGALGTLTRCYAEELGADTALLVVWDEEKQVAEARCVWGLDIDDSGLAVKRGEGFVGRLLESDRPTFEALPADSQAERGIGQSAHGKPLTHAVGAPVRSPRRLEGALCAGFSEKPSAGPRSMLWTTGSYASALALCMRRAGMFSGLVRAAREDGLTGVLNYASLEEALEEEINRSERQGHALSCCFLDLEGFKQVNDYMGHHHGNRVLAGVAMALKRNVRNCDIVGRYGGDEFVVALPETDARAARRFAARLQEDIGGVTTDIVGTPVRAWIGVAEWTPGSSAKVLLDDADRAMQVARMHGEGAAQTPVWDSVQEVPALTARRLGELH
jgi:diguanylate cyclase (GGDEF)-like protein